VLFRYRQPSFTVQLPHLFSPTRQGHTIAAHRATSSGRYRADHNLSRLHVTLGLPTAWLYPSEVFVRCRIDRHRLVPQRLVPQRLVPQRLVARSIKRRPRQAGHRRDPRRDRAGLHLHCKTTLVCFLDQIFSSHVLRCRHRSQMQFISRWTCLRMSGARDYGFVHLRRWRSTATLLDLASVKERTTTNYDTWHSHGVPSH
jgi:hypothetical protein